MNVLNAAELKKHFGVYGYFYQLTIQGQEYPCRAVLDITHHDITPLDVAELFDHPPDLLVIMMNPGSSRPHNRMYQPPIVADPSKIYAYRELVPAKPDTTQYQIMRVMHEKNFHHARILNLSDLRESKSKRFIERMVMLNQLTDGDQHSVFSTIRASELGRLIGSVEQPSPVVVGWGRETALQPLAYQCLQQLTGRRIVGVPANREKTLFSHPSPMLQRAKIAWLSRIFEQM